MKKIIAIALIMVLALSLLTACGDNSGNNNTPSGGNNSTKPSENKTPSVTVNPGDTIFDNDVVTIVYTETTKDSTSMDICFEVTNHSGQEIAVAQSDFVINGKTVGIGYGTKNFTPGKKTDDAAVLFHSALSGAGFSADDIKTVQITFTATPVGKTDVLFQGTALINIVLP